MGGEDMDTTSLFAAFSLVSVFVYLYIGIYTFRQNTKSILHKGFLLLCTSYAIWSFAYAFAYVSSNSYVFSIWNKISAIGWCSFSAISLYLVLLITENKIAQKMIVKILIFLPSTIFFYMAVFLFGYDINTSPIITDVFYIGDFLYNFTFLFISIALLFIWGIKSDSKRIKKQSTLLVTVSVIPFFLNLLTQTIMPLLGIAKYPNIGTYVVITKYKFLRLPQEFLLKEIEDKMMDMVIFLNEKYQIIRISKHTLNLLGYEEYELLNKDANCLFDENSKMQININDNTNGEKNYNDMGILRKNGNELPINMTYIPVFDKELNDFLGSVFVMQDISIEYELKIKNKQLEEKSIRDGLTKLYNHQYSIELIKREIENINKDINKNDLSLLMLDIDFFKKVNDTYGHQYGDYVLEVVSDILIDNVNDSGKVGRFGGEEFIIILPKADINKAYEIGEKVRNEIEDYKFDKGFKLTISIGIKQFKDETSVQLVKRADDLLYKAKQNGRNRIEY
jgi:two-component system cell cycle response regulator